MSGIRPAWAPDGRILLLITTEGEFPFFGPPESRTAAICSVEPDGSALSVITAVPDPTSSSLSPDGRWLLIWGSSQDRLVRVVARRHEDRARQRLD